MAKKQKESDKRSKLAKRKSKYIADGRIDCEIEHPIFGWIPFTADPNDVEVHGRMIHADLVANGSPDPYIPPATESEV